MKVDCESKDAFWKSLAHASCIILLVSIVLTSIVSSLLLSKSSYPFRPVIQPSNNAFLIWSLIFALGVIQSVYMYVSISNNNFLCSTYMVHSIILVAQIVCYIACSAWSIAFFKKMYCTSILVYLEIQ